MGWKMRLTVKKLYYNCNENSLETIIVHRTI